MSQYADPVSRLLTLGDRGFARSDMWDDYRQFGLSEEHVPELIRLAGDLALMDGDWKKDPSTYGPMHAWRALGQLRAEAAVAPLLQILHEQDASDSEIGMEEIPQVLAEIGPPAIPLMAACLADQAVGEWSRINVAEALGDILGRHPDRCEEIVGIWVRQLEQHAENPPELNAALIGALTDQGAVESAGLIEQAFAARHVHEGICGDWDHIKYELGLGPKPEAPPTRSPSWVGGFGGPPYSGDTRTPKQKVKAKKKRKLAAQSRKRNRRK